MDLELVTNISEHALLLDRIEARLRAEGETRSAEALLRLQVDAGFDFQSIFTGHYPTPGDGTITGGLKTDYRPVEHARASALFRSIKRFLTPEETTSLSDSGLLPNHRFSVPDGAQNSFMR